jgi:hypothetical protein
MNEIKKRFIFSTLILAIVNMIGFVYSKNFYGAFVGSIIGWLIAFLILEIRIKSEE